MTEDGHDEEEWRPADARLRAALWEAERRLVSCEWAHAEVACGWALVVAEGGDREVALGLRHLAAAGMRERDGRTESAARQREHARRRLAPFLPEHQTVDLGALLAALEREDS